MIDTDESVQLQFSLVWRLNFREDFKKCYLKLVMNSYNDFGRTRTKKLAVIILKCLIVGFQNRHAKYPEIAYDTTVEIAAPIPA